MKKTKNRDKNRIIISSSSSAISVMGKTYRGEIDKKKNIMYLRNQNGKLYTSFPLDAAFISQGKNDQGVREQSYSLEENHLQITFKGEKNLWDEKKAIIKFHPQSIEVSFGCLAPVDKDLSLERVTYFVNNKIGLDDTDWGARFTPEPKNSRYGPDQHYMKYPFIEARMDDDSWIFTPPPLNLSFQTPAGWFSIGCCRLPNSNSFKFSSCKGILVEEPENHIKVRRGEYYWSIPVVFTFNASEWDGMRDYYNYLVNYGYVIDTPITKKSIPQWWMRPTVCTYGEEILTFGGRVDEQGFNTNWVKNYVLKLEKRLGYSDFTVIIDDKWQKYYGDPTPSERFNDLRDLIEWCHDRGHKVILWWMMWKAEENSLAEKMGIVDRGFIDATSTNFKEYVAKCMRILLGNGKGELNANGLKLDYLFQVRNPFYAKYQNPSIGIGFRELHHYLKTCYDEAKKVKSEALITSSSPNPHFLDCQDMIRLNDLPGNWKFVREERAKLVSLACPNMLIDGDGGQMFSSIADYHYVVSAVYSSPSLYYESRFPEGTAINNDMMKLFGQIFKVSAQKQPGRVHFVDYGRWQMERNGKITAECFNHGTILIVYPDKATALVITTKNQPITIPLQGKKLNHLLTSHSSNYKPDYAVRKDILTIYNGKRGIQYELHFIS